MRKHLRIGVAAVSLLIAIAAVVCGVVFGTRKKSGDDGQLKPAFFMVSFETFGGSKIDSVTGEAGSLIVLPSAEKEGYAFEGWFTDEDFLNAAPTVLPAENTTYYAKFEKIHTVRFVMDDETVTVAGKTGERFDLPDPSREKAEFDGWYLDRDFRNTAVPDQIFSGDTIYYAKFTPVYTVRFMDGTREMNAITGRAGTPLSVPSTEKEKNRFGGWYADEKLTEPVDPTEIPQADTVFYAKFSPLYTITFYTAEGGLFSFTGLVGETLSAPDPTCAGWEFEGWFSDESRLTAAELPTAFSARDERFYGKYAKLYTLRFETDGGTQIPSVTAKAGTPLNLANPEKDGYLFEGWTAEENGTTTVSVAQMPESDAVYYAKFAKLYHAVFEADGREISRTTGKTGAPVSAPLNIVPPAGYVFLGWQNEDGESVKFPVTIGAENAVYRAAFGEIPVLRFYANPPAGKEATGNMTAVEGIYEQPVSVPIVQNGFSVSGYRFAGWALSEQGGIAYRDGDTVVFSKSVSLYARWARGYTNTQFVGVRVYYCDADDTAVLVEAGREQAGKVSVNRLGETEFEIGNYAGRFESDGTFTARGAEYGEYESGEDKLFLSGYGTASLSGTRADIGVYKIEMGNLVYFEGRFSEGSYRIGQDKTYLYIDNTAVFGYYYNVEFAAFVLDESARFGGQTGIYVAGNGKISFYFGGVETQADYSEEGGILYYNGVYFYRAAGDKEFVGEGVSLTFGVGIGYPVSAVLKLTDGVEISGELSEADGGLFLFYAENGDDTEEYLVRLTYGSRIPRMELVQSIRHAVWTGDEGSGYLYTTEFYDYENHGYGKRLAGEIAVADGGVLALPEQEFSNPESDCMEYEIERNGIVYGIELTLFYRENARCFSYIWYGLRAAEILSACGNYRIFIEQFAGSAGVEEYENLQFGDFLSFSVYAGDTLLPVDYAFSSEDGMALFHLLSGELAGQYRMRFSFDGGFLVGFSCERKEFLLCGSFMLVRDGAGGFECLYDLAGEDGLVPLLQVTSLSDGMEKISFGASADGCVEFVYERVIDTLTRCLSRTYETNGFTVYAVVGFAGERVFTVHVFEGTDDLGEAELRDGIWTLEFAFHCVDIRFSNGCTEAVATWVKKQFTAENGELGIVLTYTLSGTDALDELLSASIGTVRLTVLSCEFGLYGESDGYHITAVDPRQEKERHFVLWLSGGVGTVEGASLYAAEDRNATISLLYGDDWYAVLPAIELDSQFGKTVCRGTLARTGKNWALRAGAGKGIGIEVTRRTNLLAPFTVEVNNLPELVVGENEFGEITVEAAVLFEEDGTLSVFALTTADGSVTPRADEIVPLGDGRWYFSGYGLILSAEDGLAYLEACERIFTLTDGAYCVELAEVGILQLPVRLFHGGEAVSGTFTEISDGVWEWRGESGSVRLVFSYGFDEMQVYPQ